MTKFFYILILTLSLLFLFAGCDKNQKPEPATKMSTPVQVQGTPQDIETIARELSDNLDRQEHEKIDAEQVKMQIENAEEKLKNCDPDSDNPNCDKQTVASTCLLLGDLYFEIDKFAEAADYYHRSVIYRFEGFESAQAQYEANEKINLDERQKLGDKPALVAGGSYLKALFCQQAYKDFAEIVRAERRLSEAQAKAGNEQDAADASVRAEKGLKKSLEYLSEYEKQKQILLGTKEAMGDLFTNYGAYIEYWDRTMKVNKI